MLLALLTHKQVRIGTLAVSGLKSRQTLKLTTEARKFYFSHADSFDCFSISKNDPEFGKIAISLAAFLATISLLSITKSSPKSYYPEIIVWFSKSQLIRFLNRALRAILL